MKISLRMLVTALLASLASFSLADDVTEIPPYDQFFVIPLRVHVLSSKKFDFINAKVTDDELTKTVKRINEIWHKAGIHFGLEAIYREPAEHEERFQAIYELQHPIAQQRNDIVNHNSFTNTTYAYLLPTASRTFDGQHVYVFKELPYNSLYVPVLDTTLVQERPTLTPVEGGMNYALARVSARGLGLALGLSTRSDAFGLLSGGTSGVGLSVEEVATARRVAPMLPGTRDVVALAKEADALVQRSEIDKARRLWTWLSEIPGEGAAAAKKKLETLPSGKP